MILNFDELNKGVSQKQTDPRKLFTTLDRNARFKRPLDEQSDVLDNWFLKRDHQDITIKMNTGAGKTLVGLLALQSSINESVFPAVFVTPDNYLVSQVVKEAKELGIRVTEDADNPDFIAGRAILVINIMKLINGRSVFGVAPDGVKIKIGAIVIDDAHACLQTVAEQFSLVLKNSHDVYKELFKLFREELSDQSRFEFLSVEAEDPNALVKVPFWSWSNKYTEVSAILHKHRYDDDIKFAFPLVSDVIRLCHCVIGGKRLEIAPKYLPIDVIPAFARAQRRIYMTATLADDGILVSHFNAKPEFASDPIKPKGVGDMGDRMILAPQEINPKITRQEIKELAIDISKKRNVVVIVPSSRVAEFWKDAAALVLDRTNIGQGVDRLKSKHVGLVVLINKYDGVDLPDEACRLLVIDGVPEVYGLIERTEMAALAGTEIEITRQVQRIEQGMGRGVRSSDDYCVVLLLGSKLSRRVHSPSAREKFNSSTLAQIDLGISVTQQVRGKPVNELRPVLDLCLDQDINWRTTSRNALVNAVEVPTKPIDPVVICGRAAFDLARSRDFPKAADTMRTAVDATHDDHTRGYYLETVAEYTHAFDPARAQEILLSATQLNNHVARPIAGIKYAKLTRKAGTQAAAAVEYMRGFKSENDLLLAVNALIDDLVWDENRTKEFEAAIFDLGALLGLDSQRPEQKYKSGPDNLWSIGDLSYIVIECKSGAKSPTISKSDCDQLGGSVKWFFDHYDKSCTAAPLMIHPHYTFDKQASPLDSIRIMDSKHLSLLQTKLREYAAAISGSGSIRKSDAVEKHLRQFGFIGSDFLSQYSRGFLKQS